MDLREKITLSVYEALSPLQMSASVTECTTDIIIEPDTRKTGFLKPRKLDGMQIIYTLQENEYEVREYQAGIKNNEIHIYARCKTIKGAISQLLKGNKRKPIDIWN